VLGDVCAQFGEKDNTYTSSGRQADTTEINHVGGPGQNIELLPAERIVKTATPALNGANAKNCLDVNVVVIDCDVDLINLPGPVWARNCH
jgi:hypothetical protein